MSFDDLNENIRRSSGSYINLRKEGDEFTGILVDVKVQDMMFKGVPSKNLKTGEQRIEWMFTLEMADGSIRKWAAREVAQYAIKQTLAKGDLKLERGGKIYVKATGDSVQGQSQAPVVVEYIPPAFLSVDTSVTGPAPSDDPDF